MQKSIYPWQKIGKFHENDVLFSVYCFSDVVKGMQLVTPKSGDKCSKDWYRNLNDSFPSVAFHNDYLLVIND